MVSKDGIPGTLGEEEQDTGWLSLPFRWGVSHSESACCPEERWGCGTEQGLES